MFDSFFFHGSFSQFVLYVCRFFAFVAFVMCCCYFIFYFMANFVHCFSSSSGLVRLDILFSFLEFFAFVVCWHHLIFFSSLFFRFLKKAWKKTKRGFYFMRLCSFDYHWWVKGEQDGRVVKMPVYWSEGPKFDPRQHHLVSCHSRGLYSRTQAHKVYFYCLPPCLSDETLNRGPESIA